MRPYPLTLGIGVAAAVFVACAEPVPYRVAVLAEARAPWTPAAALAEALRAQGFSVTPLAPERLADPASFSAAAFDALVLSRSPLPPAAARGPLLAFAKAGGDLVLLGGPVLHMAGAAADPALAQEAFEAYEVYRLRDVCAVRLRPEQSWLAGEVESRGAYTGLSALGFPELGAAAYVPLLAAVDRYGRTRGWAAGALLHHAGAFAGSQWLLFGVNEEVFYLDAAVQAFAVRALSAFRDGAWLARAQAERANAARVRPALGGSVPGAVPLTIRDGHFVRPDGTRFFAIGANFFNSFHTYYGGGRMWDLAELERDFGRMRRAGVNALRLHDAQRFLQGERTELFLGLCRTHGVYILPTAVSARAAPSLEGLAAEARRKAALLKREPMVLGYDLDNEPYWWELARLTCGGRPLSELHPVPKDAWRSYQRSLNLAPGDWTTTFPGLRQTLPLPGLPEWRQAYQSVSATYGAWIEALAAGLRSEDSAHPLSVGYNTVYACLPVNARLDFVAHHVYEPPEDLERVRVNMTTLDRLRAIWPGKPVLLGEFGYSNGDLVGGRPLDVYASSVGEFAHHLHALAGGFDGTFKWELCDADPAYQSRWLTWMRDAPEAHRCQQRRFGMFVYDGTPEGRAKPIAHATRFLRDWLETHAPRGALTLRPADYPTGTAYTFEAEGALFVGDRRFASEGLRFESADPANVLLAWDGRALRLLSTADARVELCPSRFVSGLSPDARAEGTHGGVAPAGNPGWLAVTALEGEVLTFRLPGAQAAVRATPESCAARGDPRPPAAAER